MKSVDLSIFIKRRFQLRIFTLQTHPLPFFVAIQSSPPFFSEPTSHSLPPPLYYKNILLTSTPLFPYYQTKRSPPPPFSVLFSHKAFTSTSLFPYFQTKRSPPPLFSVLFSDKAFTSTSPGNQQSAVWNPGHGAGRGSLDR